MKSTISIGDVREELSYPFLGESTDTDASGKLYIVLFVEIGEGTVVYIDKLCLHRYVGEYYNEWDMSEFIKTDKVITLSN